MFETIKNAFKVAEVRRKILLTLLFVFIYRLGCYIPIPGLIGDAFATTGDNVTIFSLMNAISGSALEQGAWFAIGISPYINASIIMQLLTVAIPALERLNKDGEDGKKKVEKITRYVTLGLSVVTAVGVLLAFRAAGVLDAKFIWNEAVPEWIVFVFATLMLVSGCMACMWIGERITEYGVSNGISMLIFVGILSTAGRQLLSSFGDVFTNGWAAGGWEIIGFLLVVIVIFGFIIWVDGAERRVKVQYAKQIKGNKMYGGQSTYIPVKVNGSGVLPLIFAFALLSFIPMIANTFWADSAFAVWWTKYMTSNGGYWVGTVVNSVSLALLIFGFSYFYSQIQFNPIEISKNLQQNGGFIPGIRPGRETSEYLARVVSRITFWGATFLAIIALVPSLVFGLVLQNQSQLLNAFSSTGMLIIVNVALEFDKALENQLMMRHYKGFLK
ncbi:MAG: preprotein translocase subunit SecY [Clostridia bacterium]|nr:preprotein translocase subunit SecY [Clostridia bacterium]